jgi:hypothetical protein
VKPKKPTPAAACWAVAIWSTPCRYDVVSVHHTRAEAAAAAAQHAGATLLFRPAPTPPRMEF